MEVVEFEGGDLQAMQRHVGGYVQFVEGFRPACTFVCNEEGKIHGMEVNRRATLALWVHHTEFVNRDTLNGDVLILGPVDDETGETLGAPDELVELFFNTPEYRYLVKTIGEDGWHGNGRTFTDLWKAYNDGLALSARWALVEKVKVVAA